MRIIHQDQTYFLHSLSFANRLIQYTEALQLAEQKGFSIYKN
jgi:hypothetical protein